VNLGLVCPGINLSLFLPVQGCLCLSAVATGGQKIALFFFSLFLLAGPLVCPGGGKEVSAEGSEGQILLPAATAPLFCY